ncbi:MAG TPA: MATE family efflux transporter, partial [Lachnospiraceae bacterium]|nr:MATE family efflux transporter [Lachnospiraceae bacterium]
MQTNMTKGNPFSIIIRFMLPLMLGNIFQQLYNMADTIIVGRTVGQTALAAVGSTGTIMFLMQGFAIGLTTGFTVLTSQTFGAGDERRTRRSVANAVLLALITAAAVT